jgi:hypothetical protein
MNAGMPLSNASYRKPADEIAKHASRSCRFDRLALAGILDPRMGRKPLVGDAAMRAIGSREEDRHVLKARGFHFHPGLDALSGGWTTNHDHAHRSLLLLASYVGDAKKL